jgi:hypothetical protein
VDWESWSEDERRAALSHVLLPRNRSTTLNADDFADTGPNKPRAIQLSSPRKHSTASGADEMSTGGSEGSGGRHAFGRTRTLSLKPERKQAAAGRAKSSHGEVEATYGGISAPRAGARRLRCCSFTAWS